MTELRGRIVDAADGRALEARVRVVASTGETPMPESALRKVGPGQGFFYAYYGVLAFAIFIVVPFGAFRSRIHTNVQMPKNAIIAMKSCRKPNTGHVPKMNQCHSGSRAINPWSSRRRPRIPT